MRLTLHTDYALRILIYLALSPGRQATVAQIADAYNLSRHHLLKVAQTLRDQGLILTVRGRGGGLRLARDPQAINIGALTRGANEDLALVDCLGSDDCRISSVDRLKGVFSEALTAFMDILSRYSLADVAGNGAELTPTLSLTGDQDMKKRKADAR